MNYFEEVFKQLISPEFWKMFGRFILVVLIAGALAAIFNLPIYPFNR